MRIQHIPQLGLRIFQTIASFSVLHQMYEYLFASALYSNISESQGGAWSWVISQHIFIAVLCISLLIKHINQIQVSGLRTRL